MKYFKIDLSWNWLMVAMVLLTAACSSGPPSKSILAEPTSIPPSSTPIPSTLTPLPPTLAPTATPLPGAAGYLVTLADMPADFSWTNSFEMQSNSANLDNQAFYNTIFYTDAGWLHAELTVAKTPYEKIPDGLSFGQGSSPVDSVPVGQSSQAYMDSENPPAQPLSSSREMHW